MLIVFALLFVICGGDETQGMPIPVSHEYLKRERLILKRASDAEQFIWQSRLPASVFVAIVAQCELADIYSLSLACHVLHRRISQLEYSIALEYLHRRKRRRRSNVDEASVSPGDDLTFISDLFPPPPPQYTNETQDDRPEYSFGYLADLTRCWTTCIRLSYYLADYAVHNHLQTDPVAQALWSSSKIEKDYIYTKAVSFLQSRLLRPMYVHCNRSIIVALTYCQSVPHLLPGILRFQSTNPSTQRHATTNYPPNSTVHCPALPLYGHSGSSVNPPLHASSLLVCSAHDGP